MLLLALVISEIFWKKIQVQNETISSLLAQTNSFYQNPYNPQHSIQLYLGNKYCTLNKDGDEVNFDNTNRITITDQRHINQSPQLTGTYSINKQLNRLEALLKSTRSKHVDFHIIFKITDVTSDGEVLGIFSSRELRQEWCEN